MQNDLNKLLTVEGLPLSSVGNDQIHEAQATIVEKLRNINKDAWAEIDNPGGWTYHTNIGLLIHQAADEIERLEKVLQGSSND